MKMAGSWANDLIAPTEHGQLSATWHGYQSFGSDNYDLSTRQTRRKLVRVLELQRVEDMID